MNQKSLLRAVYVGRLPGGSATVEALSTALGEQPAEVERRLQEASAAGLLEVEGGEARLTPRGRGELTVVMIGGKFEIIHPGHVHTMAEARKLGDTLVVVVAADSTVAKNKGREPVTGQEWRVRLVSAMREVDAALPGGRGSIYETLEKVRPDIVALGYDQIHDPAEVEREARRRGMEVRVVRLDTPIPGIKTSKIFGSL